MSPLQTMKRRLKRMVQANGSVVGRFPVLSAIDQATTEAEAQDAFRRWEEHVKPSIVRSKSKNEVSPSAVPVERRVASRALEEVDSPPEPIGVVDCTEIIPGLVMLENELEDRCSTEAVAVYRSMVTCIERLESEVRALRARRA